MKKCPHCGKDLNKAPDKIDYKSIIDYLNLKTGKTYRSTTPKTQELIRARWKEGFRGRDFAKVVDNMVMKWTGDPHMEQYLRPQTLFGTKFESYLQVGERVKPKPRKETKINTSTNLTPEQRQELLKKLQDKVSRIGNI